MHGTETISQIRNYAASKISIILRLHVNSKCSNASKRGICLPQIIQMIYFYCPTSLTKAIYQRFNLKQTVNEGCCIGWRGYVVGTIFHNFNTVKKHFSLLVWIAIIVEQSDNTFHRSNTTCSHAVPTSCNPTSRKSFYIIYCYQSLFVRLVDRYKVSRMMLCVVFIHYVIIMINSVKYGKITEGTTCFFMDSY